MGVGESYWHHYAEDMECMHNMFSWWWSVT